YGMNKTLKAMMIKLSCQQDELLTQLHFVNASRQKTIDTLNAVQLTLSESKLTLNKINPEVEINRLNFISSNYLQQDELRVRLNEYDAQKLRLDEQFARIKTELKLLEQYTERQAKYLKQEQVKKEEQAMDEWALQHKDSV
ncbi:MAG: hypothetical protein ACRC0M_07030, partial [Legionella sp.]